jgi:hypothetical protein
MIDSDTLVSLLRNPKVLAVGALVLGLCLIFAQVIGTVLRYILGFILLAVAGVMIWKAFF